MSLLRAIQQWLRASPPIVDRDDCVSFAELWQPVATGAVSQLLQGLTGDVLNHFGLGESEGHQKQGIRAALHETLVAELSKAGEANLCEPGRPIHSRMLEELRATALSGPLEKNPVLGSRLSTVVAQWITNHRTLLRRVFSDRYLLIESFGMPSSARIGELKHDFGDPDRDGRWAVVLGFDEFPDASRRRYVMYMPNDLGAAHPPRSGRVVIRPGYEYMDLMSR